MSWAGITELAWPSFLCRRRARALLCRKKQIQLSRVRRHYSQLTAHSMAHLGCRCARMYRPWNYRISNSPTCWFGSDLFLLFYALPSFSDVGNGVPHCLKTQHGTATSCDAINVPTSSLREKTRLFNLLAIYYSLDTENHSCSNTRESPVTGETVTQTPNGEGHFSRYNLALT